jgi:dTMP kinase
MDSTRVYQGVIGHVDARLIRGLERVTVGDLIPDLTFIMDVPVDVGMKRAQKRRGEDEPDRFEAENVEFHDKLRRAFAEFAKLEPQRCILIDATQPKEDVHEKIWTTVSDRLLRRRADRVAASAP